MSAKEHTVDVNVVGDELHIQIGDKVVRKEKIGKINNSYLIREFGRGLKLRIDNASAGIQDDQKKTEAKLEMVKKIEFDAPDGGITGGRKKEGGEAFLKRVLPTIKDIASYQRAVQECQACVRKDEQSDAMLELSVKLSEIMK